MGWHNESLRHGLSAKGLTSGRKSKSKSSSSWSNLKSVYEHEPTREERKDYFAKQLEEEPTELGKKYFREQLAKEMKEHPTLPKKTVKQIVVDHEEKKEKKDSADISSKENKAWNKKLKKLNWY